MSARAYTRNGLELELDDAVYTVRDHAPNQPEIGPGRCLIVVYRSNVAPSDITGRYTHELRVWILTGHEQPEKAEDDLDQHLPIVWAALKRIAGVNPESAERGTFGDAEVYREFHGYQITATAEYPNL